MHTEIKSRINNLQLLLHALVFKKIWEYKYLAYASPFFVTLIT